MYKYLTTLYEHRIKKLGIITAAIMLVLDLLTYTIPCFHFIHYDHHILLHYMIVLSLILAITSKDKVDDELSRTIRYSIFKNTLTFSVVFIGIATLILSTFGIEKISTLIILYFLEAMLVLHLVLYHLGLRYSPKWLLTEDTAPEHYNKLAIRFMVVMIVVVFFLLILTAIIELTGIE